jgi:hypothetical protein
MSRVGDTTATAGYDARWPIRAYHVARLLERGPRPRSELATAARSFTQKSLVEDILCAMENDRIVVASTPSDHHMTRGERISFLQATPDDEARFVPQIVLTLSDKGRRFLEQHDQGAEAGACSCEWCAELAEIRAWAERQTPEQISAAWLAVADQIS